MAPQPIELTWRVHLAKEQPARAAMAVGVIVFFVIIVGAVMHNLFWPLLSLIFLVGSLHDFFLPMTFEINGCGVAAKGFGSHRVLEWERARRFFVTTDGVKLSPLAGRSKLEDYRGVFLRCTGERRERVVEAIRARSVSEWKPSLADTSPSEHLGEPV